MTKSLNKMKDVRLLYKGCIPEILKNIKKANKTINEDSIFGNLNYSIDRQLLIRSFKNRNYSTQQIKVKRKRKISQ
jgi:hypothetical protein